MNDNKNDSLNLQITEIPFKDENIYRDLNGDGTVGIEEQIESNEYTPDERKAFMHEKVDANVHSQE